MKRTQLYLDDELWGTLRLRSQQAGTSISALVRQAAREKYGIADRHLAMQALVGIWKNRAELPGTKAYVRALRKGSRLKRLR
jgi:hypothetical protein